MQPLGRAATGTLHAARTPLETVLRNLLANAVRHHDRGGGAIDVRARMEGAFYVISVTDDGPGIAPADHVRIFKPFQTLAPVEGDHVGGIEEHVAGYMVKSQVGPQFVKMVDMLRPYLSVVHLPA